jgi:hypothetical protein
VDVAGGQQLFSPGFEPAVARIRLAFWAMPVAARIIRDGLVSALGTHIGVPAERRCTAAQDGVQHLQVEPGKPFLAALEETFSGCAWCHRELVDDKTMLHFALTSGNRNESSGTFGQISANAGLSGGNNGDPRVIQLTGRITF